MAFFVGGEFGVALESLSVALNKDLFHGVVLKLDQLVIIIGSRLDHGEDIGDEVGGFLPILVELDDFGGQPGFFVLNHIDELFLLLGLFLVLFLGLGRVLLGELGQFSLFVERKKGLVVDLGVFQELVQVVVFLERRGLLQLTDESEVVFEFPVGCLQLGKQIFIQVQIRIFPLLQKFLKPNIALRVVLLQNLAQELDLLYVHRLHIIYRVEPLSLLSFLEKTLLGLFWNQCALSSGVEFVADELQVFVFAFVKSFKLLVVHLFNNKSN